jgi:hypothetical protein
MSITNFPNGFPDGVSLRGIPSYDTFFGRAWYVDAKIGSDGNSGKRRDRPFQTMAKAISLVDSGDVIYFRGKVREQVSAPLGVSDVTIIGASNKPRHADDHTESNGVRGSSGSTWMAQASGATALTPLLTVKGQGWRFANFLFASAVADAPAVKLDRNQLSGNDEIDGGHAEFYNMRFDANPIGIQVATTGFIGIYNSYFRGNTTSGIGTTTGGGGSNGFWDIRGNRFMDNGTHILAPLVQSTVWGNISGKFTTKGFDFTNGSTNSVHGNWLSGDYDAGYVAGASDDWAGNYSMDVSSAEVGAEGLTILAPAA